MPDDLLRANLGRVGERERRSGDPSSSSDVVADIWLDSADARGLSDEVRGGVGTGCTGTAPSNFAGVGA